jgi:hypothetical protein
VRSSVRRQAIIAGKVWLRLFFHFHCLALFCAGHFAGANSRTGLDQSIAKTPPILRRRSCKAASLPWCARVKVYVGHVALSFPPTRSIQKAHADLFHFVHPWMSAHISMIRASDISDTVDHTVRVPAMAADCHAAQPRHDLLATPYSVEKLQSRGRSKTRKPLQAAAIARHQGTLGRSARLSASSYISLDACQTRIDARTLTLQQIALRPI